MLLEVTFWLNLILVLYTFAGYAALVRLLNTLRGRGGNAVEGNPVDRMEDVPSSLSIILVVSNEADRITPRISNLIECEYEGSRELILVCDGCKDETANLIRSCESPFPIRVVEKNRREGKASGLNTGVKKASGDILVFADARQSFDREALRRLVAPLRRDDLVAGVSGSLEIERTGEGTGAGIDAYWKFEKWLRNEESKLDSVIGCTGAIYALRREAYEEIPDDTLIDDVVIPMQALVRGKRILFEPKALAYDPQTLEPRHETRRKVRTLAGNYQMLFRHPSWLNPLKNRCWWQLISHKYLRLISPFFLIVCLISSALLALDSTLYRVIFGAQLFCYGAGILGMSSRRVRNRMVTIPAGFLFLQWQSVRALAYYLRSLRRGRSGVWSS